MNLKTLAEKVDLEEAEYLDMIDLFLKTTAPNLTKLETGIKMGDTRKVIESAHSIKGSAASLGLIEISEMAKRMEMNARKNSFEDADGEIQLIKENLVRIVGSLAVERSRGIV